MAKNPTTPKRQCRVCGCSEDRACLDGCAWVPCDGDLCDSCYWVMRALRHWTERAPTPNLAALHRETATVDPAVDRQMEARAEADNRLIDLDSMFCDPVEPIVADLQPQELVQLHASETDIRELLRRSK